LSLSQAAAQHCSLSQAASSQLSLSQAAAQHCSLSQAASSQLSLSQAAAQPRSSSLAASSQLINSCSTRAVSVEPQPQIMIHRQLTTVARRIGLSRKTPTNSLHKYFRRE